MKTVSEAFERVLKARCGLLLSEPFFGTLVLQLEVIEDPKVKTISTDGRRLTFAPEFVQSLSMPELEAVIAHEVLHCAWQHQLRRGGRDPKSWNEATDYVVNSELVKAKFTLPTDSLIDPRYDGMTAETVYDLIQVQKQDQQSGSNGKSGSAGPGGSERGRGDTATGFVEDAKGEDGTAPADAAEAESQANDWQQHVAQALQASKGAGQLSGNIERMMKPMLAPRVDWKEALPRLLMSKTKEGYDWNRPNRRFLPYGMVLPSISSPNCGTLAFGVDASGSITQRILDQFAAEVDAARQVLRPELTVVMLFDTAVKDNEVFTFGPDDVIELTARKGGGTRFDGPVLKLAELNIEPEVLVYLTDLDSTVFPPEPVYPVVWVTTRKTAAPFGEVIEMH